MYDEKSCSARKMSHFFKNKCVRLQKKLSRFCQICLTAALRFFRIVCNIVNSLTEARDNLSMDATIYGIIKIPADSGVKKQLYADMEHFTAVM